MNKQLNTVAFLKIIRKIWDWDYYQIIFLFSAFPLCLMPLSHTETLEIRQANSDFSTKTSIAFPRCCNTLSQHVTVLWKRTAAALSTTVSSLCSLRLSELRRRETTSKWIFRHKHWWVCAFKTQEISWKTSEGFQTKRKHLGFFHCIWVKGEVMALKKVWTC